MSPRILIIILLLGLLPSLAISDLLPNDIMRGVGEATSKVGRPFTRIPDHWQKARTDLQEKTGFGWTSSYHAVALAALGGDGAVAGSSGDLTFQAVWKLGRRWFESPNELRFRFRHRHAIFGEAASAVGPDVGTLWGFVDGFSNSGFEIPDAFFRHVFPEQDIELRYGQMAIDSQFGGHQLASSKRFFLNQAFAAHPAIAFPRFGAGLTLVKNFDNGLSIGLGSTTVQGTQQGSQVDLNFGSNDFFHVLQFSYAFDEACDLRHRLALLGWHSDEVEDVDLPRGRGVQLFYERALDDDGARFFSTLAWSNGGAAPLESFFSIGLGKPCGEEGFAGIAAGIGRGSNSDHPVQAVVETFYSYQPHRLFRITPDLQLLFAEDLNESPGIRLVAGLRGEITF